jgi:predicted DNA-binding transcriptional regulator AlpA
MIEYVTYFKIMTRPDPSKSVREHLEVDRELNGRERLLTTKDVAELLKLSLSWLAKARMRGDGPPYVKLGRSVRYGENALASWARTRTRHSTSER